MKSAVAMMAALLYVASVGAFVAPVGRPCSSARHSRTSSARCNLPARSGLSMMSSVVTPPSTTSAATQEPRGSDIEVLRSNDDFLKVMEKHEDKLVVIKVYDQFCRACDEIRPRFVDLSTAEQNKDTAVFYELEFSSSKDLCKQLGIKRLPTVQIYNGADGRVADLPAGPSRFEEVEKRFSELVESRNSDKVSSV